MPTALVLTSAARRLARKRPETDEEWLDLIDLRALHLHHYLDKRMSLPQLRSLEVGSLSTPSGRRFTLADSEKLVNLRGLDFQGIYRAFSTSSLGRPKHGRWLVWGFTRNCQWIIAWFDFNVMEVDFSEAGRTCRAKMERVYHWGYGIKDLPSVWKAIKASDPNASPASIWATLGSEIENWKRRAQDAFETATRLVTLLEFEDLLLHG